MRFIKVIMQRFSPFLNRILTIVQGNIDPEIADYKIWQQDFMRRRLKLTIFILFVVCIDIAAAHSLSGLSRGNFTLFYPLTGGTIALCLVACWSFLSTSIGRRHVNIIFLLVFATLNVFLPTIELFFGYREFDWFHWPTIFFTLAILIPVRWKLHAIAQISSLVYYFSLARVLQVDLFAAEQSIMTIIVPLSWLCGISTFSVLLYERLMRSEFEAHQKAAIAYQKLSLEKERSEALLLNILPDAIAQRLKADQQIIADDFAEVTVLFADLVNFTPLSASMSPTELVKLLNQIFSRFDRLVEKHDLEKIKTIGDAYMAVGGLPEPTADHVSAIAEMSLDMQEVLWQFNQENHRDLSLRIGIHTGSVVAGVIGLKKFAYDLWGDTVNTASRMESHSLPGYIHVSDDVYQTLKDRYLFEERGIISIKGKGEMKTYFLKGIK